MNPFSSNKNVLAENLLATGPDRETRRWLGNKTRMCWKCQKDKPYKTGKLTKFNKQSFTRCADKFICFDCLPKKETA